MSDINITTGAVITSTVIYGIVHAIWSGIKWGLRHLQTDTGQIINKHVKDGHHVRLTKCYQDACAKLGTGPNYPHQVESQLEQ